MVGNTEDVRRFRISFQPLTSQTGIAEATSWSIAARKVIKELGLDREYKNLYKVASYEILDNRRRGRKKIYEL